MSAVLCLLVVMIAMSIGDIVSMKTKAFVPSVFVTAFVFLLGFWYILPSDVVSKATLGMPVALVAMYLLIVHMGTLMNVRELISQWRTVVISLAGVGGIILFLMTIGVFVLGRETAVVGAPPLTGGIVAAIIMKDAATTLGNDNLAVIAILVYVVQGFVGYPLTALLLKREGKRLLNIYKNSDVKISTAQENTVKKETEKTLLPVVPEKYNTTYLILARLALVAWLADIFTKLVNTYIFNGSFLSPFVTCLIFGVIAAEIGIVDRQPLNKANAFGWMMTVLMAFIFEGLNKATPEMLKQVAIPLLGIIIIGVTGLLILSFITGKILKESPYMALPIALNALYGFPPNFILTNEVINSLSDDKEELKYLSQIMVPKMLIGGFTSVTIASVIIGGIFSKML
ncbi:hypothetical protein [Fusobacterium russii]|uniref:hypothetical protein n=1 Tax=Fusobacterium russii TaxID=854 RepID=UPI00039A75CF|nr:hypothetical protein [Fusobacterium russii]